MCVKKERVRVFLCVCVNGPGGGGCMPPALCINLNLLVCLAGKLRVSSRGGRVFAPGLRYMEAEKGVHCWSPAGFVHQLCTPSWSGLLQISEAR